MALKSMTGFARTSGRTEVASWVWEVRSVNGRGLDVRLRLPPGYDSLDAAAREIAGRYCNRGSLNVTLTLREEAAGETVRLNEAVLADVMRIADVVHAKIGGPKPDVAAILAQRGVLDFQSQDPGESAAKLAPVMLASFEDAMRALVAARESEGARLKTVIERQLAEIERLVRIVEESPARSLEAVSKRLSEQLARILGTDGAANLDPQRLHQEAALIATRADVEEELKRLAAHIEGARELLSAAEPVGRRFDFLTQEFNREANTLCSKANDTAITRAGLDLKAVIDQMREQIQNIE
ncbi:MAG TPA: YicC family protein [Hyphomicrobiaceae bacterium]|nr:YicC family protein [Hyphomicrobiaceae bacterium]